MAKSSMKYMVRAWNKELKKPEWCMGSRKLRKACARDLASASIENEPSIPDQNEADYILAEELTYWND